MDKSVDMEISSGSCQPNVFYTSPFGDSSTPLPSTLFYPTNFLNVLSKTSIQAYDSNEHVRSFLSRGYPGIKVLNYYYNNKQLIPHFQNLIVEILLQREVQNCLFQSNFKLGDKLEEFEVTTARFKKLAAEIGDTFNEDPEIYYIASTKTKNGGENQSGKLWERFNTEKKNLRLHGILTETRKTDPSTTAKIISAEARESLDWLSIKVSPREQVEYHWRNTIDARKTLLENDATGVLNYFNYPCVRNQHGIDLINIDFKEEYSKQTLSLFTNWSKLKSFIKKVAIDKFDNKSKVPVLISDIVDDIKNLKGDHEDAAILKILTHSIKITGLKATVTEKAQKKRKFDDLTEKEGSNKVALSTFQLVEIQESLIVHANSAGHIETEIQRKKTEALKKKITLQPYILIVGAKNVNLASYVVVDDIKYQCKNVIEALDLTFKIFFVSDAQYPTLSRHIWLFLQRAIYRIFDKEKIGTVLRNMIQSYNSHHVDESTSTD